MSVPEVAAGGDDTGSRALARLVTRTDVLAVSETGEMTVDGWSVPELLATHGSPLFIISETVLRSNYCRVYEAFSKRWPAPVNVMYAIKANNNLAVRAVMGSLGAGGDCFSEGEIFATMSAGADVAKLALNGSNKSAAALRAAVEAGITINIDSNYEIDQIAELATELGVEAQLCIRLRLQSPALDGYAREVSGAGDLNAYIRSWPYGLSSGIAADLIDRVSMTSGVRLVGFHHHIGRYSNNPALFRYLAETLGTTIIELHQQTGFWPSIVNIGGGLAREREPESGDISTLNPWSVEDYADAATSALLRSFEAAGQSIPQLWLEPGRYIAGNAGVLAARVGGVRSDVETTWLHIDASVNDLSRADAGWDYACLPASRMNEPAVTTVDVVGSLCRGGPIARSCQLPTLVRDDVIAFLDAGMYAEVASANYNSIPRPATVLTNADVADVIKVRETVADVFAHHRIPERLKSVAPAADTH